MAPPNIAERLAQKIDVIDEKTQAALSQIGREEKAAVADEVSPIVRHRASLAQLKVTGFAEPVIGPARGPHRARAMGTPLRAGPVGSTHPMGSRSSLTLRLLDESSDQRGQRFLAAAKTLDSRVEYGDIHTVRGAPAQVYTSWNRCR